MERIERIRRVRTDRLTGAAEVARIAIGAAEGTTLFDWVRREHARQTLETGLGFGISTLFICEGLLANGGEVRHVAIDPFYDGTHSGAGVATLEEAGVRDLVELLVEPSETALPRLLAEGRRFDLAFVDGNHRFEGVLLDFVYCGRLLQPGGIVFADDAQLPAVRKSAAFVTGNLGWTVEEEGGDRERGWLVLRTGPADVYRRPFDSFVEF
jgi:predicted O-methyltransferase YrrM